MQSVEIRRHAWRPRTWLIGCVLVLCALMGWAQTGRSDEPVDPAPAAPPAASADDVRRGFQHLSRQVGQLQQSSMQSGRAQLGQGDAIRQQIAEIEYGQLELGTQLSELQDHNLQQVQALQEVNHRLVVALGMLAGVLVLLALQAWRWRPAARKAPQTAVLPDGPPSPMPQLVPQPAQQVPPAAEPLAPAESEDALAEPPALAAPEVNPVEPLAQAEPEGDSAEPPPAKLADTVDTAPAAQPPAPSPAPPLKPLAEPSPWLGLVAADLLSTEQALAQARQGFMQPVQIEP